MPFYEYVCTECGEPTELLQKLSDPPETECPSCHAQGLIKQISAAGFRLKGSGWYETDFKSGEKRNLVGDSETRVDTGDTKSSLKADAKPDVKSTSGDGSAKTETSSSGGDKSGGDAKAAAKPKESAKTEAAAKPATKSTDGSKTAA